MQQIQKSSSQQRTLRPGSVLEFLALMSHALMLTADLFHNVSPCCSSSFTKHILRGAVTCRKMTSLVDKVNAERLKREFKSFKAFMKQLDEKAPPGKCCTYSIHPESC